jgi:hypothetical protein
VSSAEQEKWLQEKATHSCSKHGGRFLPEVCILKKEQARESGDTIAHCANCVGPVSLVDGSVFVLDGPNDAPRKRGRPARQFSRFVPVQRFPVKPKEAKQSEPEEEEQESKKMEGLAEKLPEVNPKADQEAIPTKVCSGCGVEKPATKEFFNTNTSCRFGVESKCKACKKAGLPSQRLKQVKDTEIATPMQAEVSPVIEEEILPRVEPIDTKEAKPLPDAVIIGPATLIGKVLNVRVDFTDYPQLLDCIRAIATEEVRTPEQQIIYFCRLMLGNWKGRSDEGGNSEDQGNLAVA